MEQNDMPEVQEDILIENHFELQEEDIREFTHRIFFSPILAVLLLFFAISGLASILSYIFTRDTWDLIQAISIVAGVAFYYYLCHRRTTLGILRAKESNNGTLYSLTTKVQDEGIMIGGSRETDVRLAWYDLRPKVYESRHLLFLRTKGYQLVIFKKGAYTLGDEEDLKDLLAAKGFKVK
jgi:hypothetical protein